MELMFAHSNGNVSPMGTLRPEPLPLNGANLKRFPPGLPCHHRPVPYRHHHLYHSSLARLMNDLEGDRGAHGIKDAVLCLSCLYRSIVSYPFHSSRVSLQQNPQCPHVKKTSSLFADSETQASRGSHTIFSPGSSIASAFSVLRSSLNSPPDSSSLTKPNSRALLSISCSAS